VKILVVEDQSIELKLAVMVLSAAGYEVESADAAEQVMEAIREDRPQIILLDLSLPGMDGLTLARKLKADAATRDIQIVAITAWPEKFPMAEALAAGCDAYLRKPINTRTLPTVLAEVVENAD
jgi:two-component system cell cycle response regulator